MAGKTNLLCVCGHGNWIVSYTHATRRCVFCNRTWTEELIHKYNEDPEKWAIGVDPASEPTEAQITFHKQYGKTNASQELIGINNIVKTIYEQQILKAMQDTSDLFLKNLPPPEPRPWSYKERAWREFSTNPDTETGFE